MEEARSSESVVSYHISTWRQNPEDSDMNFKILKYKGKVKDKDLLGFK
jgi:hypothetical protein